MSLRLATREFRAAANVCKILCECRTVPLDGFHLWRTWNPRAASLGSFASMVLGLDPCVPIPYKWHVLSFPPVPPSPARQCCEKVCMGISVLAHRTLPLHNTAARTFPPHTSGSDRSLRKGRTVRLIGGRTGKRSGSCGFSQGFGLGGDGRVRGDRPFRFHGRSLSIGRFPREIPFQTNGETRGSPLSSSDVHPAATSFVPNRRPRTPPREPPWEATSPSRTDPAARACGVGPSDASGMDPLPMGRIRGSSSALHARPVSMAGTDVLSTTRPVHPLGSLSFSSPGSIPLSNPNPSGFETRSPSLRTRTFSPLQGGGEEHETPSRSIPPSTVASARLRSRWEGDPRNPRHVREGIVRPGRGTRPVCWRRPESRITCHAFQRSGTVACFGELGACCPQHVGHVPEEMGRDASRQKRGASMGDGRMESEPNGGEVSTRNQLEERIGCCTRGGHSHTTCSTRTAGCGTASGHRV